MIYISVQPDLDIFLWQLQILLRRMYQLGVLKKDIQVIWGYSIKYGINTNVHEFIERNSAYANFFYYPDERQSTQYASSLRPHIMAKHFKVHPELQNETYYYHDADLLFRELPDVVSLSTGNIWYVGDTKGYLGYGYLKNCLSDEAIMKMAAIVGLTMEDLEKNDSHVGGAQYVLKKTSASFWEKVEKDSENMYVYLE